MPPLLCIALFVFSVSQNLNIGLVTSELFSAAQHEIYMLMERDNFSRFKRSELFKQLLLEIDPFRVRRLLAVRMTTHACWACAMRLFPCV